MHVRCTMFLSSAVSAVQSEGVVAQRDRRTACLAWVCTAFCIAV